jgi:acetoin utilization protein AcuB
LVFVLHRIITPQEDVMTALALSVARYMTHGPYTVRPNEPLGNARRLMAKYTIRHLPVRAEGKLVGVLSDRDVQTVWMLAHAPQDALTVEDAMTANPYAVGPGESLAGVVRVMADRKIDAAVVVEDERVVGVFTSTDAMRALVELIEKGLADTSGRSRPRDVLRPPRRGAAR